MELEIDKIRKNAREEIVISLTEYEGYQLIDVRIHTRDGHRTKKGISVRQELSPPLREALEKAETTLRTAPVDGGDIERDVQEASQRPLRERLAETQVGHVAGGI